MRGKLIVAILAAILAVAATSAAGASTAAQSMPVLAKLSQPQPNKPTTGKTTFYISVTRLKGRPSYKYVLYINADINGGHDLAIKFPAHPGLKPFRHNYIVQGSSSKPLRLQAIVSSGYACYGFSIVVVNGTSHPWILPNAQYCKPPAG